MFECGAARDTVARSADFEEVSRWILSDHPHAFGELIKRGENVVGELVEELVQVAKVRTERLPVVVLVVRVQNECIGDLPLQCLDDRTVRTILAREIPRDQFNGSRFDFSKLWP